MKPIKFRVLNRCIVVFGNPFLIEEMEIRKTPRGSWAFYLDS